MTAELLPLPEPCPMLPEELMPVADEWYRQICERAGYVDRLTISGDLVVAIKAAVGRALFTADQMHAYALANLSARPGVGVEGMSWIVQELSGLESRLAAGDFYSDYDADWERIARLRQCIAALTKEPK